MKVLFLPDWSSSNPYFYIIRDNLMKLGYEVVFNNYSKWLPVTISCLKNRDCSIVHIHWLHPIINSLSTTRIRFVQYLILLSLILDLLICKLLGINIFWTIHNLYTHESVQKEIECNYRKILFKLSSKVFVHSKSSIEDIKSEYKLKNIDKIVIAYHGHYIDSYPNSISKEAARKYLNITHSNKVILFFGNLREYKGVLKLIEEFKRIPLNKKASLIIAGRTVFKEYEQKIITLIDNHTNIHTYFEFIPDDKIHIYMNAADVCIFPYEQTLTQGSMILAMSFAKPVIVPRNKAINEIVGDEGAIYYDANSSLYNALTKMLSCNNLSVMGEKNKNRIKNFAWNTTCQNLADAYTQSLKQKQKK